MKTNDIVFELPEGRIAYEDRGPADGPEAEARLVAERLAGSVQMIEGAGHYPHVEFPHETGAAIEAFLGSASPVGR